MDLPELIDEAKALMPRKKVITIDERKLTVVGDLHGDYAALKRILSEAEGTIVFLGDYADRGDEPVDVYREVLKLFVDGRAIMLRGNHESSEVYPHDLPFRLEEEGLGEVYEALKDLWEKMPVAAFANDIWLAHGGIPTKRCRIELDGITLKEVMNPSPEMQLEIMWNDPWEREGCGENYNRGIFYFFGKRASSIFLEEVGCRLIVRSHEPYKVLRVEQDGKVVTVGSCAEPYGLAEFAFLKIDFDVNYRDGYDVVRLFGHVLPF
ncbi:MAG: metallophosphoesterase family protein [Archaeoglobaceae archaeon]